jgi:hypothetical protein
MHGRKWRGALWEFAKDAGGWGVASVIAAAISFGIGLWDHFHDKPIASFSFVCLTVPLFWAGAFAAWLKKRKRIEELQNTKEYPKLFLQYDERFALAGTFAPSGFMVRCENEKKAFRVTISSKATVGKNDTKLGLQWEVPQGPVGKDVVPVDVQCGRYVHEHFQPVGGIKDQAIYTFFDIQAANLEELVAVITFYDVEGRVCPPRRFTIKRYRDIRGRIGISCEPEIQAAS